jgi:hypothetical protein
MPRFLRTGLACALAWSLLASGALAGVTMRGWYFPNPYTMRSPNSPHRFGGMDLSLAFGEGGYAIAFPLHSTLTDRENVFIIDMSYPLVVGVPDTGSASFWGGSPKIGMRGNWRFQFPFSEGYTLPAAWSVGGELNIPLAMLWGGNIATLLGFPMYMQDLTAWLPAFTFRPMAQFAIGKPLFFFEAELSLPNSVTAAGTYAFLVGWGATLGSQPDDLVSITLEFGGLHDTTGNFFPGSSGAVWGALGSRFYIGQFVTGLAIRLPFTKVWGSSDGTGTTLYEPSVSFTVFVGYEQRHSESF